MTNKHIKIVDIPCESYGVKEMLDAPIGYEITVTTSKSKDGISKRKVYKKVSNEHAVVIKTFSYS